MEPAEHAGHGNPADIPAMLSALITERLGVAEGRIAFEFQDDYRFLLITLRCDEGLPSTQENRVQLARLIDKRMPTRERELTWMLNFTRDGTVADSYFGGDATAKGIGF